MKCLLTGNALQSNTCYVYSLLDMERAKNYIKFDAN